MRLITIQGPIDKATEVISVALKTGILEARVNKVRVSQKGVFTEKEVVEVVAPTPQERRSSTI